MHLFVDPYTSQVTIIGDPELEGSVTLFCGVHEEGNPARIENYVWRHNGTVIQVYIAERFKFTIDMVGQTSCAYSKVGG